MIQLGFIFCLLFFFQTTSSGAVPARTKVALQLKWEHQFQFAGYYAAVEKGYYHDVGLEVELREAKPGHDPVEAVLKGEAEFGVGTSELMLLRAQGKDVVVLGAIFQHSPLVLVARKDMGVSDIHDLVGKPIMIEPQSAELFAYFQAEGVDQKDLKIVHHSFKVEDLIQGKVAAMSAYSTDEPFQLRAAGVDILTFTPRAGGIDFYGDNLFTTGTEIEKEPEVVKAFRAASLRGWDYALAHPEEIIDLILKKYGHRKTREHLQFEAEQTRLLMHPELIEVGHMNPGRWRHIANTYADFGMVPRDFDLTGFAYDPNPNPNLRWVYWSIGGALAVALTAIGWMLPLYRLNHSLRYEIAERCKAEEKLREAKEAAEAANEAKGNYLAFMTHEVRTPLAGIVLMMQQIRDDNMTAGQKEDLDLVEHSAENLLKLISDTLDFSKLEAGRMDVESVPFMPRDLLKEICELFKAAAQAKGIELRQSVAADVPTAVLSDPARIRQVLTNLTSNAVKFTQNGFVHLEATMEAPRNQDAAKKLLTKKLVFKVTDTGEGISPEAQDKLFRPYAQADASVSRRHGGTGLGLSISKSIAELLGGKITVESTLGQGSAFTFECQVEVLGKKLADE